MGRTIWIPRADHPDMPPLFWALPDAGARDRIAAISSTSAAEKSKRHRDEALAPSAHIERRHNVCVVRVDERAPTHPRESKAQRELGDPGPGGGSWQGSVPQVLLS